MLVVLLVLLGVAVAGDRFGVRAAERTAAERLQTELGLPQPPTVEIEGIPFLTQLATSTFGHVVVEAAEVPLDTAGGSVAIDRLHMDLRTVKASDGYRAATVGSATGTAEFGWAAVSTLAAGVDVAFDSVEVSGRGKVRLAVSQQLFGREVRAEIVAVPELDPSSQTIVFRDASVRLLGVDLPPQVGETLLNAFLDPIPVQAPFGLTATGLAVTADGARMDLAGENLVIGA